MGRAHVMKSLKPHVDVTAHGGFTAGISRLHAALKHDQTGWFITDLTSSNGTWVNGLRVAPNVRYHLATINDIQFTRLELKIKLPVEPITTLNL